MKVLFVAYYFPPCGGAAGLRALRWAMCLPAHGIKLTVLAPEGGVFPMLDEGLESQIPVGVQVHRLKAFLPSAIPALRRLRGGSFSESGVSYSSPVRRALRAVRDNFFIPDEFVDFSRVAAVRGRELHARERFDAIFTISHPLSVHLAGRRLKRALGLPWIAEFGDPWSENWADTNPSVVRRLVEPGMERSVLSCCDLAVTTATSLRDHWRRRFPGVPADHFQAVPIGYDEREFRLASPETSPRWTMAYVGARYRHISAGHFFDALGGYLASHPEERTRIRAVLVGAKDEINKADSQRAIQRNQLEGVVEERGFRPHHEALQLLAGADSLLYLGGEPPEGELMVQSKVYEYLRAWKPVLAMGREVESVKILRRGPGVIRVDRTDVDGAQRALGELRHLRPAGPGGGLEAANPYEMESLTGQMAQLIKAVVAAGRGAS